MNSERKFQSRVAEAFGLTDREDLFDRVGDKRFLEILADEATNIHQVEIDSNNYGEFLFVTLSKSGSTRPMLATFYGLGFHEHRERWLLDWWFWYETNQFPDLLQKSISKKEALDRIEQRRAEIPGSPPTRSNRYASTILRAST